MLFHDKAYDETNRGENHSDEPESHNNRFFGPSNGFEMVMEWGDSEDLFPIPELLGSELNDNRAYLEDIDSRNDKENRKRVGHHSHDTEIGPERERADIAHIELRWFYIEPQECDECSHDEHTDRREYEESVVICYECVYTIIKKQESSSEPIEPIGDIYRICHGDDDEYKERNIEHPETNIPKEREMKTGMSEFDVEPVRSESCKYCQKHHLNPSRESLGSADSANIKVIIHETYDSDGRERKEREIGLISVPEAIFYLYSEYTLNIGSEEMNHDRKCHDREYGNQDNSSTHRRGPCFVLMKFSELGSFSHKCFFTNLFTKLILV